MKDIIEIQEKIKEQFDFLGTELISGNSAMEIVHEIIKDKLNSLSTTESDVEKLAEDKSESIYHSIVQYERCDFSEIVTQSIKVAIREGFIKGYNSHPAPDQREFSREDISVDFAKWVTYEQWVYVKSRERWWNELQDKQASTSDLLTQFQQSQAKNKV